MDFNECMKNRGRFRAKYLGNRKYLEMCYDRNGKVHKGEVKTITEQKIKENKTKRKSNVSTESLLILKKHFDNNHHNK